MLTKDGVITELKGRNISKVAREVKVTRSYLSNLANGGRKQVSWDMIKKLSDYLEATK
jgi:transcriptional regulator with XRE-family HTH domain|tara:strand:- start:205 stop:378 length:174 start_codon:yes stop_codon:yes gene_type:complete